MKLILQIEVQTDDGSTPLFEDVSHALRKQLSHTALSWNDPSLGRVLSAGISVDEISQG
jgi:hypothetical protein